MGGVKVPPLTAMDRPIDFSKFMGSWYVIAHIPIFVEKNAYNAVETYAWEPKYQRFSVKYVFNEGSADGSINESYQRGFIHNKSTFTDLRVSPKLPLIGYTPLRMSYLIIDMAQDASNIVVGYPNRAYLWIMARSPTLPDAEYNRLVDGVKSQGYDVSLIRKVPQNPTAPAFPVPTEQVSIN